MDFNKLWFYDIEVFPNFFSVTVKNKMTGTVKKFFLWEDEQTGESLTPYSTKDELKEIYDFFYPPNPIKVFCGYFNSKYDDVIMAYVLYCVEEEIPLSCRDIKDESDRIINGQNLPNEHPEKVVLWKLFYLDRFPFTSIDCYEILRSGYNSAGSLKMVGIKLKHPRVQETYFDFNKPLMSRYQVNKTLDYNKNDVAITEKTFDNIRDQVELREDMVKRYGINSLITASDSTIAKTLFKKWYCERAKIKVFELKEKKNEYFKTLPNVIQPSEIIFDDIEFKTDEFKKSLEKLKSTPIVWYENEKNPQKSNYEFQRSENGKETKIHYELNGCSYVQGLGGIHSEDKLIPGIFFPNDDEYLLDADVGSQYPSVILNRKIHPAFMDEKHYYNMFKSLVDERLDAKDIAKVCKKSGDKTSQKYLKNQRISDSLKIVINSGYGFFKDKTFVFYDPYASYKVTMNCQLYLLMLIEDCEMNGIKVLSANTDGIIIRCKKYKYELFQKIKKDWEQKLNFTLEETFYDKYIRKDVNNYIAREVNGEVKNKGAAFLTHFDLTKGWEYPITKMALNKYYLEGVPIMDTLRNHNDIYDFCKGLKVSVDKWDGMVQERVQVYKITTKKNSTEVLQSPKIKYIIKSAQSTQIINRWFVSLPDNYNRGQRLRQYKQLEDTDYQYNTVASNRVITIFNDYVKKENYNIDYDFYYQECMSHINKIDSHVNPI